MKKQMSERMRLNWRCTNTGSDLLRLEPEILIFKLKCTYSLSFNQVCVSVASFQLDDILVREFFLLSMIVLECTLLWNWQINLNLSAREADVNWFKLTFCMLHLIHDGKKFCSLNMSRVLSFDVGVGTTP